MTSIALEIPKWNRSADLKAFLNWLLVWVLLSNVAFMMMWFVGAPPREFEIIVVGIIGLLVRSAPYLVQAIIFLLCMVANIMTFVGGLFNLSFLSLLHSVQFFAELNPVGSTEYLFISAVLAVVVAIGLSVLKRGTNFTQVPMFIGALAIVLSVSAFDYYLSIGNRGHYKRDAPTGTVFESAVSQSGFAAGADGKRNLMLVMVESLGVPADNPEMERLVFAAYKQPVVKDRYKIKQGTSLYFNSTTAGEIREMCGRWGDYYDLMDRKDGGCLPAQLAEKGYDTQAVHSFKGDFFDRKLWYPNIGFKEQKFWEDLKETGIDWCGGVFAGACDHQVPPLLGEALRKAEKPTFLYWLTVNTHLPVPAGLVDGDSDCSRYSAELATEFPMICRQLQLTDAADRGIVEQIMASDFPDTDILIVGDHMPPYFDLKHRSQFNPERVPWIYLQRK